MKVFTLNRDALYAMYGANIDDVAFANEKQLEDLALRARMSRDIKLMNAIRRRAQQIEVEKLFMKCLYDDAILKSLRAVFYELENALFERLAVYTPIDTGNLISSIYSKHIGLYTIQIGYDTRKAPYAAAVHEMYKRVGDCRHPQGGIDAFLLTAIEEAFTKTMASAADLFNTGTTLPAAILYNTLSYGIDISRDKLAVTISMSPEALPDNLTDEFRTIGTEIRGIEKELVEFMTLSLENYTFDTMSKLNKSNHSRELLASLTPEGLKALNMTMSAVDRLRISEDKTLTAKRRYDRLGKFTENIYKKRPEEIEFMEVSRQDQLIINDIQESGSHTALAQRITMQGILSNKIIYPLIIDKVQSRINKIEKEAARRERERWENDEITDEDVAEYFAELEEAEYAEYENEEAALAPD